MTAIHTDWTNWHHLTNRSLWSKRSFILSFHSLLGCRRRWDGRRITRLLIVIKWANHFNCHWPNITTISTDMAPMMMMVVAAAAVSFQSYFGRIIVLNHHLRLGQSFSFTTRMSHSMFWCILWGHKDNCERPLTFETLISNKCVPCVLRRKISDDSHLNYWLMSIVQWREDIQLVDGSKLSPSSFLLWHTHKRMVVMAENGSLATEPVWSFATES